MKKNYKLLLLLCIVIIHDLSPLIVIMQWTNRSTQKIQNSFKCLDKVASRLMVRSALYAWQGSLHLKLRCHPRFILRSKPKRLLPVKLKENPLVAVTTDLEFYYPYVNDHLVFLKHEINKIYASNNFHNVHLAITLPDE